MYIARDVYSIHIRLGAISKFYPGAGTLEAMVSISVSLLRLGGKS